MNRTVCGLLLALAAGCVACGPGTTGEADAGPDGGPTVIPDAAPTDAGGVVDAGFAPDSGPEPDAGPAPMPCPEVGARRTVACGNCGLLAEECGVDHTWAATSECLSQGECSPSDVEAESLPACGMRQRICDDACTWRDWTTTADPGDCEVGASRLVPAVACGTGLMLQECDDACAWMDAGCDDGCGNTARLTPEWAREVCVPAGPFVRGHTDIETARPVAEIVLSRYYIDVYPVTNLRYRACVDSGACVVPTRVAGAESFADPTRDDYPVQAVTWAMAQAFCAWDGGRTLPSEAQWEKAARGPAPREQRWVWDTDAYRCDLLQAGECPIVVPVPISDYVPDVYDALPGTRSYYGTYMQYGGVREITRDWYGAFWYGDPASRVVDPEGPMSGTNHVTRGTDRERAGPRTGTGPFSPTTQTIAHRSPDSPNDVLGIRCVRIP